MRPAPIPAPRPSRGFGDWIADQVVGGLLDKLGRYAGEAWTWALAHTTWWIAAVVLLALAALLARRIGWQGLALLALAVLTLGWAGKLGNAPVIASRQWPEETAKPRETPSQADPLSSLLERILPKRTGPFGVPHRFDPETNTWT